MKGISAEGLAVREFERSLELKTVVETKAANYMVVVTLILTILTTLLTEVDKMNVEKCSRLAFAILYAVCFILGIALLLVFVFMQRPRRIQYLPFNELVDLAKDIKKSDSEKISEILEVCEECVGTNKATVKELDALHEFVTTGVPALLVGFFIEFVMFFVFFIMNMGVAK